MNTINIRRAYVMQAINNQAEYTINENENVYLHRYEIQTKKNIPFEKVKEFNVYRDNLVIHVVMILDNGRRHFTDLHLTDEMPYYLYLQKLQTNKKF